MEQFHEDVVEESSELLGLALEELDGEREAAPPEESVYTDDPVRVYLREMGSVALLTRQGEVELARRMERGKLRVQKVLSRSPLVWKMVVPMHDDVRQGKVRI